MRQPDRVLKEIHDLDALVSSSKELQYRFPEDTQLSSSITHYQDRKLGLITELDASLKHFDRHSIHFVFTNASEMICLEAVVDNLKRFKMLVDKAYEHVTHQRKSTMPMFFNTVFGGAFSVLLSTPFEEELFHKEFDATFELILGTIQTISSASDKFASQYIKHSLGENRRLIKRFSTFFKALATSRKSMRIGWHSPSQAGRVITLEYAQAERLYRLFQEQEQFEEERVQLYGTVKGISLIRFYIEFKQDLKSRLFIKAHFSESMAEEVKKAMDKYVLARFNVKSELNDLTDEVVRTYELQALSIQPSLTELFEVDSWASLKQLRTLPAYQKPNA